GEGDAVSAGALQAETPRHARGARGGPGAQGGMSRAVVGEDLRAGLALGWQEAGIEGILTDVDADPGGRGGVVLAVHGVVLLNLMDAGEGGGDPFPKRVSEVDDAGGRHGLWFPRCLALWRCKALSPAAGRHHDRIVTYEGLHLTRPAGRLFVMCSHLSGPGR